MNATNSANINRVAFSATLHCLTGCAIGEIMGMVIGSVLELSNLATFALAITLAFIFGYTLSAWSLLRTGVAVKTALITVLAADTLSITVMEIVDNAVLALTPGVMDSHISDPFFWLALLVALIMAFGAAYPVNRYLLLKGKGHALIHDIHHHHQADDQHH